MNMHVTSRDVRTIAEQIANRKAVRDRVYGPMKTVNRIKEILAPSHEVLESNPERQYEQADAHMRAWRIAGANVLHGTTKRFIVMRGLELGFTHEDLLSRCRTRKLSEVRQAIMWEVYETCGKSTVEIGRLFNRDPSTVNHAVKKMNAIKSKENAA
jgi:hypothetical protein